MKTVLLPKNKMTQKLDRNLLSNFCGLIEYQVKSFYEKNTEEYIIQDGPPYANGDLHLGHLLNKTLKDFYVKYMLTNGKKVRIKFGWDCHGLPIENRAKDMPGDLLNNCKNIALSYKEKQKESINLFGIFSTEEDYLTMNPDYVERELKLFNELNEKGFVFKKNKPTWYSPTLKTVLANSEIEYKDVTDESLYFLLPVCPEYSLLVWTTTEWTVSGNQAVCLNPEVKYCLATYKNDNFICSESFATANNYSFKEFDVTELSHYFNTNYESCPILFDEFVSDTETGIVHLSGGHGDDDYNVLLKNNITPKNVVTDLNDLSEHINSFRVPDNFVFKRVPFTHSYPIDWRAKEKVVKVLTEQTYLDFDWTKIKSVTKQIKLSSKDRTRLESMLFSRKDWCLSRQRKWGVNIPDSTDILDVWFDSGTAFTMFDKPADLYIEGTDQHRGWFQSSIIIAAMVDKTPTKRILTHGFVVIAPGEKLDKSSGKSDKLKDLFDLYNPDVLRLWVLLSDYKNEIVFSKDSVDSAGKQYFRLRNFMRYLVNNLHRENHVTILRYDLQEKLDKLKASIKTDVDNFDLNKAIRNFVNFTNEYSSFLTEDKKNMFYESDIDSQFRVNMENEFYGLALQLSEILFPFLPFLSTEISLSL